MSAPDLSLLGKRRFAPLFLVQFLGALNDNLLKFALLFLANYGLYAAQPGKAEQLATIATGLFILPYFLFSALAGQLADAWDKAHLVRLVKGAEIGIMALAVTGFYLSSVPVLLSCLFLMGLHSTIFGPVKYSILPQHLTTHEIMGGTGLIEAGTFVAILSGQLLAGHIPPWNAGVVAISLAAIGFLASLFVPSAPAAAPGLRVDFNIARSTWQILRSAQHGRGVWLAILGISWFFAIGAVLLSEFAPLTSNSLKARQEVVTLFLLIFSVSVAVGSVLVNKMLKGEVSARYVPASALAMAGFMIDLWLSTTAFSPQVPNASIAQFLATPGSWRIVADLVGLALAGGMFIVPLYAILQMFSPPAERSRTIAANNIINAVVTVLLVIAVTLLLAQGTSISGVIGAMGFATLAVALISCWLLPEPVIKALVRTLLTRLCRIDVSGAEHMPQPGQRAVVVVDHLSLLDAALLSAFLPGKLTFAVPARIAGAWWMKPFLGLFDAFAFDPTSPMSARAMMKALRAGRTLVILPEGAISVASAVMKMVDGPDLVAANADTAIIPVRIDVARFTPCSRLQGKVGFSAFPKMRLTILPPQTLSPQP